MLPKRVIPCFDVDAGRVVKGTEFVNLRDMGDPVAMAQDYERQGADELVFLDITATSRRRSTTVGLAQRTTAEIFVPFTVGGGIRSESDVQALLDSGADKVAINSAALADPDLINRTVARFGSQCIVVAIDAKSDGSVYAAGGRLETDRQAVKWAREVVRRGAGEILLTSIDRDGTQNGYDLGLTRSVTGAVNVPVIASGGAGRLGHYQQALAEAGAEAVLAASQLHSGRQSLPEIKDYLLSNGVVVRPHDTQQLSLGPDLPKPRITLVDYGAGNRYSVQKALERVGADVALSDDVEELAAADGLVLPGVGAFGPAMERLNETGLAQAIKKFSALGKPILGICLGEQLLFDGSEEQGWTPGLGLIPGTVQEIGLPTRPNIGWREVTAWKGQLAAGLSGPTYFYHLHQYAAITDQANVIAATRLPYQADTAYQIASAVRRGNTYGVQFHPEKSGPAGLNLLKNFVKLVYNRGNYGLIDPTI